jgi:hypothetical protein
MLPIINQVANEYKARLQSLYGNQLADIRKEGIVILHIPNMRNLDRLLKKLKIQWSTAIIIW